MHLIDLHIHSKYSGDSDLGIRDILDYCSGFENATIAVSDHNNIRSIDDLSRLTEEERYRHIEFIPSVELSAMLDGERVHLLYYFKDKDVINPAFRKYLTEEYSRGMRLDVKRALGFKDYNSVVSLAHPKLPLKKIEYLRSIGVDAMELFNSKLTIDAVRRNLEFAVMLDMPVTLGSDSHGSKTAKRAIGKYDSQFLDISYARRFLNLFE